jgi:glutaconate CoA-transferase subunit A
VDDTFLPAIDVDVVAHVPLGAHPCGFGSMYDHDATHFREYLEAAKSTTTFQSYLARYVYGVRNHGEYLERVDVHASPRPSTSAVLRSGRTV